MRIRIKHSIVRLVAVLYHDVAFSPLPALRPKLPSLNVGLVASFTLQLQIASPPHPFVLPAQAFWALYDFVRLHVNGGGFAGLLAMIDLMTQ